MDAHFLQPQGPPQNISYRTLLQIVDLDPPHPREYAPHEVPGRGGGGICGKTKSYCTIFVGLPPGISATFFARARAQKLFLLTPTVTRARTEGREGDHQPHPEIVQFVFLLR